MGQFSSLLFPQSAQQQQQPDDVPWLLRYSARAVGCVGGGIAVGLGIFNCVTLSPMCIVAGIFQVLASFIVIVIEAPCCCFFIEYVQQLSTWADSKPYWQKAAFYLVLSLPAIVLCFGLSTLFGSGLIFATAVLYGMMALGKKAPREEMMLRAASVSSRTELVLADEIAHTKQEKPSAPIPP